MHHKSNLTRGDGYEKPEHILRLEEDLLMLMLTNPSKALEVAVFVSILKDRRIRTNQRKD